MLALTLTCALLVPPGLQFPQSHAPEWVATGVDRGRPAATVIRGTAELDPSRAYDAARREAVLRVRERWVARAEQVVSDTAPAWLPAFVVEQEVRRWLVRMQPEGSLEILDRTDRERQHDFGASYQTSLLVAEDPKALVRAEQRLGRQLRRAEERFLARAGGTLGVWALLALVVFWLDRLSRGYMTVRLSLLALAIGAGVPVVLFLV